MSFTKFAVWQECRRWAAHLDVPATIDKAKLLYALSGCESSFGANCAPRHEPSWHAIAEAHTNPVVDKLTALFGCDAHSSFGPWQLLLLNAIGFAKPEQFADLGYCGMQTACFINHRIVKLEGARTVGEIAAAYNAGRWKVYFDGNDHLLAGAPAGIERYVADCQRYYDHEPIPAQEAQDAPANPSPANPSAS